MVMAVVSIYIISMQKIEIIKQGTVIELYGMKVGNLQHQLELDSIAINSKDEVISIKDETIQTQNKIIKVLEGK